MATPDIPTETVNFDIDAVVADVLQEIANAEVGRDFYTASADAIGEQIDELFTQRQEAQRKASEGVRTIAETFPRGRALLWETLDKPQGYASGAANFANALRLSPVRDEPESIVLRETRVRAALELSRQIEAGVPAVVSWRHDADFTVYSAGIPGHDGFSFRTAVTDPLRQFMLGVGACTNIPVTEAWKVYPGHGDFGALEDVAIDPAIDVYTGEAVLPFLISECARYISEAVGAEAALANSLELPRTEQAMRGMSEQRWRKQMAAEGLVATVQALRQVGMRIEDEPGSQQQVVDLLCSYLFATGDENGYDDDEIMAIGEAMQYVYPSNGEVSLTDYIITRSRQLSRTARHQHRIVPVLSVLTGVYNMDQLEANRRLHER
ncbi:MAG TPA: hypothetical protein VGO07_02255 [Candidatus Saccharimonadales bacterium]|jgi:hypothetical protein|nr:hypothetical protein [Candidatus Saccharimonadales bacterium]